MDLFTRILTTGSLITIIGKQLKRQSRMLPMRDCLPFITNYCGLARCSLSLAKVTGAHAMATGLSAILVDVQRSATMISRPVPIRMATGTIGLIGKIGPVGRLVIAGMA